MSEARAIRANFSDWRTVKSRKCLQLVFEVPMEQQDEVLRMLGAPLPDRERWCGIALLATAQAEPKAPDPDRSERARATYRSLPPDKRAAADCARHCADFRFWNFAMAKKGMPPAPIGADEGAHCANWMRAYLGVKSRGDVAIDPEARQKWEALRLEFETWANLIPEIRG